MCDAYMGCRLRYGEPNAVSNAISYAMHRGRSHMPFSCAISFLQGPSGVTAKVLRCVGGARGECTTEVA